MLDRKQAADLITGGRLLFGLGYVWLGIAKGVAGLPVAGALLLANLTADCVDGPLARSHHPPRRSWLGDRDLEVDMLVTAGMLIYLVTSGLAPALLAAAYLVLWLVIFTAVGILQALGVLSQVPVYGWMLVTLLREVPAFGWWLLAWAVVAGLVRGRYFLEERLPAFFEGMGEVWRKVE
jgi:phosphatidylglycerophosphate synthase